MPQKTDHAPSNSETIKQHVSWDLGPFKTTYTLTDPSGNTAVIKTHAHRIGMITGTRVDSFEITRSNGERCALDSKTSIDFYKDLNSLLDPVSQTANSLLGPFSLSDFTSSYIAPKGVMAKYCPIKHR